MGTLAPSRSAWSPTRCAAPWGPAAVESDLDSADKLPNLTQALVDLRWSAEDIHAAYGNNVLRVIESGCRG